MVRVDKAAIFSQIKGGIKKSDLSEKYQPIFDLLNTDNNDVLDSTEVTPERLNKLLELIKTQDPNFDTDGFALSLQNAGKNIIASRTRVNSDGTKTVETIYNNAFETTIYYPDGEIKMQKKDTIKRENVSSTITRHTQEVSISEKSKNKKKNY